MKNAIVAHLQHPAADKRPTRDHTAWRRRTSNALCHCKINHRSVHQPHCSKI